MTKTEQKKREILNNATAEEKQKLTKKATAEEKQKLTLLPNGRMDIDDINLIFNLYKKYIILPKNDKKPIIKRKQSNKKKKIKKRIKINILINLKMF
jgi:hypothetical protein